MQEATSEIWKYCIFNTAEMSFSDAPIIFARDDVNVFSVHDNFWFYAASKIEIFENLLNIFSFILFQKLTKHLLELLVV